MHHTQPYRFATRLPDTPVVCPYCRRAFAIELPNRDVSLTTCPHGACQAVALICQRWAAGGARQGCLATSLATFTRDFGPRCPRLDGWMVFFGMFLGAPLYFSWRAFSLHNQDPCLPFLLVAFVPALFLGAMGLGAVVLDTRELWKNRDRVRRARAYGFARAKWVASSVELPEPTPAA